MACARLSSSATGRGRCACRRAPLGRRRHRLLALRAGPPAPRSPPSCLPLPQPLDPAARLPPQPRQGHHHEAFCPGAAGTGGGPAGRPGHDTLLQHQRHQLCGCTGPRRRLPCRRHPQRRQPYRLRRDRPDRAHALHGAGAACEARERSVRALAAARAHRSATALPQRPQVPPCRAMLSVWTVATDGTPLARVRGPSAPVTIPQPVVRRPARWPPCPPAALPAAIFLPLPPAGAGCLACSHPP